MPQMRLLRSLHLKVGIGVIGTIVLLSAIYLVWDTQFYRRKFLAELQESAGNLSNVILDSLIKMAMIGKHPELLQESMHNLAADSSIVGAYLLDLSGTVRFAAETGFIGRRFKKEDPGCRDCHQTPGSKPKSIFLERSGAQVLRTVAPVPNRTECHPCHAPQQRWIGMLIVDSATGGIEEKLRAGRNEMFIKAGMTVFSMLFVLGLLMNRLVIARLKKLTAATALLTEEPDLPEVRALAGPDEIGQLAAAFNRMVENLGRYRREVKEKERIRGLLLEKLVRVQEEERKRVSRELHDQLGPSLSALLLTIQADHPASCGSCEHGKGLVTRIHQLIDEVHQLAWELRPSILDDYGLDSALQRYVHETSKKSSIKVDYQHISSPELARIPDWIEVILYRVAQEAITNVVRHSRAKQASVILLRRKADIMLLVEDDGCGFHPPPNGNGHKGLGLIGMRERVATCGGRWAVESAENCGTTIRVTIPLEEVIQ